MDWSPFVTPTLGVGGLLALAVLLILRGSLVPRSVVEQMRRDKDEQIRIWQEAAEKGQKAVETKDLQINALLESTKTTNHVITALSEAAGLNSGRSRHALAPSQED